MVQREIRSGRIPLIIDGFDELLHLDREGGAEDKHSNVEPMLRTLNSILQGHAKVLITTRRTAVYGSAFDDWIDDLVDSKEISVFRFELQEPRIEDWIGIERKKAIERSGIPLE